MDELEAAAAVLARSAMDDFTEEDFEQRVPASECSGSITVPTAAEAMEVDKENIMAGAASGVARSRMRKQRY